MPILAADTARVAVCVELDGALDRDALTAALNDVVARVGPTPTSDAAPTARLDTVDLSGHDHPRAAASRWMESFDRDVASGTDVVAHLIDVGSGSAILHLSHRPAGTDPSGAVLLRRVAAVYSAHLSGGADAPLSETVPRRPVDPVDTTADVDFWDAHLDPIPASAGLSHRPAPSTTRSPSSALTESCAMSESASDDLRSAATATGTDVETVVVAAVAGYVAALCRCDEVLIGLPAIVPSAADIPTAVTLPLRLTATAHDTVAGMVAAAGERIGDVRAHSAGWVDHPSRALLRTVPAGPGPVVNVVPSLGAIRFADVHGDLKVLYGGPVDDLRITVGDTRDRIRVDFEAHPARYLRAELRAHHARFLDYLSRFIAAPGTTRLATLDVISVSEHIEVVDEPNATDVLMPPSTVTELLEMGMARDDDRVAVTGGDSSTDALTHGELDCRANQLTRLLLAAGVRPESVVGVMTADRVAGITAMLAVLRAGGAVLPLDPADHADTIADRISRARPTCVVTDRVLDDVFGDPDVAAQPGGTGSATGYDAIPPWVESIPMDAAQLDEMSDDPISPSELHAPARLGNPVWIAFDANGPEVVLTHRAVANRLQWLQAHSSPEAGEHVHVGASAGEWLWNTLLPLSVGGTVDVAHAPAGESVLCGPAETAFGVLPGRGDHRASHPEAGRPVWNTAVYVLDAFLRPLPVGAIGEMYVAGDQVARGYASDPGATSDRFVANPFRPGTRMVRTGVAALRRPDGSVEPQGPARGRSGEAVSVEPRTRDRRADAGATATSVTPRELDQRSNQWARLLIARDLDATSGLVVLDDNLRPVPAGASGELYVTGNAVARGFPGDPALTATRFVASPSHLGTDCAGSVIYRTGHIVTMSPDGHLTFLGRSDSFV